MSEVLVTSCPGSRQCAHLISLLYSKGKWKLRLAARCQSSQEKLQSQYPDAEVVQVDLGSLRDCQALLAGAAAAYHFGPSLHPRESAMGLNMVDAAVAETKRAGSAFRHFVYSSVMGTQIRNIIHHDSKALVEERLHLSAELSWTILQPTNLMEFFPVALLAGQEEPVMETFWNPEVAHSMIALRDLTEAAARVLSEGERHYFAQYPLCSCLPMSEIEVAEVIGRHIGKQVRTRAPAFEQGVGRILQSLSGGLVDEGDLRPDITKDIAERLVLFGNRRGLRGNPNVLRWLLGREPTTMDEWVQAEVEHWTNGRRRSSML